MKLKRTIIDGIEVYVPLTEEEEKTYQEQNEENQQLGHDEKESRDQETNNKNNDEYINVEKDKDNLFNTIADKVSKIADIVGDKVGTAFEKTGTFVKKTFDPEENAKRKDTNDKNKKLAKLLPYLSEEDIHNLLNRILEGDESLKDIDLNIIFPYLSSEDAGALFLRCIKEKNKKMKYDQLIQYIDEATLDQLVDLYLNGELEEIDIEDILPYLNDKNIKKVFEHEILNK